MKVVASLLIALTCGSGLYAAAAVLWSMADPNGAGRTLLFTIPVAVVTMAICGLLAAIVLIVPFRSEGRLTAAARTPAQRTSRTASEPHPDDLDADLALAA